MTTGPHDASTVETFLDGDTRQLWVRVRATGEADFIEDNTAPQRRAEAAAYRQEHGSEKWGCIVPTCHARITFAGKTKRDFYRHDEPFTHNGESADHIASKAMLDKWANARLDGAGSSEQEVRINQVPGMSTFRVADVMTTWHTGEQVALEVEYKNFDPLLWEVKQNDFDIAEVTCTWLIGHSRLVAKDPENTAGEGPWEVRLTPLALALAKKGFPVLAVNPATGQVGTVAATPEFDTAHDGNSQWGYLALDPLDDCDLNPQRGLITPAMRRLETNIAERVQREAEEAARETARKAEERARWEAQQAAWREKQAAAQAEEALKQQRMTDAIARRQHAWETSPDHAHMVCTYGEIPPVIVRFDRHSAPAIRGQAAYWHTAIYRDLIEDKPAGTTFQTRDCWAPIFKRGMDRHPNYEQKGNYPLYKFLEALETEGLLRRQAQDVWVVLADLKTLKAVREQQAAAHAQQQAADQYERMRRQQANAEARRAQRAADLASSAEMQRRQAEQREANRTVAEQYAARWNASELKARTNAAFGTIPQCIVWPGDMGNRLAFNADYLEIRAFTVLNFIHDKAPGTRFNVNEVLAALSAAGYLPVSQGEQAIANYLFNLSQRGILTLVHTSGGVYSVTGSPIR